MSEIDYGALRRQSRLAGLLTGLASAIVLVSLAASYFQTLHAKSTLRALDAQIADEQSSVSKLRAQKNDLRVQVADLSKTLASVVSGNTAATKKLESAVFEDPSLAKAISRVFVHQSNNAEAAEKFATQLRQQGFVVLAPDKVPYSAKKAEIVFFSEAGDAQTQADLLAIKEAMRSVRADLEPIWVQQDLVHHHPYRTYGVYMLSSAPAKQ